MADGQGAGTIVDDEPRVSIGAVTKREGNSGTTPFVFILTLSAAYGQPVAVGYTTAGGTATRSCGQAQRVAPGGEFRAAACLSRPGVLLRQHRRRGVQAEGASAARAGGRA